MTTDMFKLLARYNHHANTEMGRILSGLTDEEWNQSHGGYYPSIRSLCSHIFQGDQTWLKRFASVRSFAFGQDPFLQRTIAWGELIFPSVGEYLRDRELADGLLSRFVDELVPEDLSRRLRYATWQGVAQDREFGGLVLHLFNHQTHHRGMVSVYLDMLGKANDFSNIIPLV